MAIKDLTTYTPCYHCEDVVREGVQFLLVLLCWWYFIRIHRVVGLWLHVCVVSLLSRTNFGILLLQAS